MSLDNQNADPHLNAFESALARLRPQPSRINRDRLLFEAGREAEQSRTRRARRQWLFSSGVAAVAAASFGILLLDARTQLDELHVALRERPVAAAVASAIADERHMPERRPARSEIPRVRPKPSIGQTASGSAAAEVAVGESAVVAPTPAGGQENYLALRNRALRLGIDAFADASVGLADHKAAGASDAPAANRDLRQRYPNRSVRRPDEFETFRRGLPVFDGERS